PPPLPPPEFFYIENKRHVSFLFCDLSIFNGAAEPMKFSMYFLCKISKNQYFFMSKRYFLSEIMKS
ncbi:hypothetical protein DD595_25885, partial [Enterobacter cloacae complex sp. 4DZ3-17B2]